MELEFMVGGPLRGDWGREPRSGMKGLTATAGGASGGGGGASSRSLSPGGKSGVLGWKVGLGGTEIRCWICCEEEPVVAGGTRGHAGGGGAGSGRWDADGGGGGGGGASLRRSMELAEVRWEPYGGG